MRTITTIEDLMDAINGKWTFGLRGASEHDLTLLARGYLDCSQDLWDRRDCEYDDSASTLSGTSAIYADEMMDEGELAAAYNAAKGYAKNHHGTDVVLLINDKSYEWGDDENEIVLGHDGYGADIIAVVDIQ